MKTVIEMAKAAGLFTHKEVQPEIERFAELVRADEREKYKWDVHSCGPTCKRYACVSMREAIEAEREACAKVCESQMTDINPVGDIAREDCADAIRARSNT